MAPKEKKPATTNIVAPSNRKGELDGATGSSSTISGGVEEETDEDVLLAATTGGGTLVTEPDAELETTLREVATLVDVAEVA